MNNKLKTFLKIAGVFLIWRVLLFLISGLADNFLAYLPSFPYFDSILLDYNLPRWLYSWANFDGVHYLRLIRFGYHGDLYIQAFFPVYPLIFKFINYVINNLLISSLIVSNISFLLFLYFWYDLIKDEISKAVAFWSTATILLFPTSFYLVSSYTESTFLLFIILSFWFARKKNYLATALFIALASATRVTGILVLPAIIIGIIFKNFKFGDSIKIINIKKHLKPILITCLGSLGLFSYMYYLYKEFGDPLYFFHVQAEFGDGVRQESLVSYPRVIWRYIKILLTARPFDWKYFSYVQDLIAGTVGLAIIVYSATKTKISYVVFALLAFFLPTLTGTFSAMPRFILVAFPIYIVLGIWAEKSKIFRYTWFTLSGILLVLNIVLFIQGYWIA